MGKIFQFIYGDDITGGHMRYFDYDDNEEFQDDVNKFFEEGLGEDEDIEYPEVAPDIANTYYYMPKAETDTTLRLKLLFKAMEMASKTFFWKFRSTEYKMAKIMETFLFLEALVFVEPQEEP